MIRNILFLFVFFYTNNSFSECSNPKMPLNEEWQKWLLEISEEFIQNGINKKIVSEELLNLKPLKKIILRDRCQPESTITFKEYLYYRLDKTRIYKGRLKKIEYLDALNTISSLYNIQPRFIVAIWGLESYYGSNQGKSKIIPVLTTLTFDQRRSSFYKKQLFAALKMLDQKLITSDELVGSWAGAMGQVQFLPTTYLDSAVDFDKDGKKDIWNNELDAFASIANYLTSIDRSPWDNTTIWGREVLPPENIDLIYESLKQKNPKGCYAVKTMSVEKKLTEWNELGFRKIDGTNLPIYNNIKGRLVAPDGINGRMFIVYPNYKTILYYNCSHYYALTVGMLSDKIYE